MPLEDLLVSLIRLDFIQFLENKISPPFPYSLELIVLLDAIGKCEKINGFSVRLNDKKNF
jgi:hypothetical protein